MPKTLTSMDTIEVMELTLPLIIDPVLIAVHGITTLLEVTQIRIQDREDLQILISITLEVAIDLTIVMVVTAMITMMTIKKEGVKPSLN